MAKTLSRPRPPVANRRARRAMASADPSGQVYESARRDNSFTRGWSTLLQSADREYLPARYDTVGRTRDIARNNPIASSGVARKTNSAVGKGWRFSSKPNARALGLSIEQARELAQQINTEWHLYANSFLFLADAERMGSWGQLLRMAANHLSRDGEGLAQVVWMDDEPIAKYQTALKLIDPDRLSNPMGQPESDLLRGGVEKNDREVPIAYHIRERHALDVGVSSKDYRWIRHPKYATPLGRPNILHFFDRERAGQTRGISKFAATLKSFRGFDRFTDATIQAATINALILGFIKSSAGVEALSEGFSVDDLDKHERGREQFYKDNSIGLGDAIFPALPLGDEISLATASKDVTSFEQFTRSIIRLIAAALGITYEELSMDYSQTNYSSARAAMAHAWAEICSFMSVIETQMVRPFFVAWLEEAFDKGYIVPPEGAPDFYSAIDAYADGRWLGPGRGYIDPTKEILAAAARIEAGISTLERECAEQGENWEDNLEQLAYEERRRADLGLAGATAAGATDRAAQAPADAGGPPPVDQRPPQQARKASFIGQLIDNTRSALSRIAAFADSDDHNAALDRRPNDGR